MDKKYLKWVGSLILVIIFAYIVRSSFLNIIFTFDKFPLLEKWSIRLNENIQQISTSDNKIVFVRTASSITALDIRSGKILWHRDTGWRAGNEPVLANNGIAFFTDNKWIWALSQLDGAVLWQQRLHSGSAEVVDVSKDFVAVFDSQQISVYTTNDGVLQWRKPVCRNSNQIHLHGSKLYFPCFGMTAVANDSGETVWETKTKYEIWIAAYTDGVMYSSPDNENITAYDLESRKQFWSTPLPTDAKQGFKIVDEFLFVTDGTHICNLHRNDGKKLWCAGGMTNPQNPVRVGDIVYIFNGPQSVINALDITNGVQLGQLRMTNFNIFTIFRQLMVSSDDLLIFGSGKEIFAFGN